MCIRDSSKDESSYARVGVRYDLFERIDAFECGTTNIDFSAKLAGELDPGVVEDARSVGVEVPLLPSVASTWTSSPPSRRTSVTTQEPQRAPSRSGHSGAVLVSPYPCAVTVALNEGQDSEPVRHPRPETTRVDHLGQHDVAEGDPEHRADDRIDVGEGEGDEHLGHHVRRRGA